MNYIEIAKAIEDFNSMTSEEIQNNIKPIIKSYSKAQLNIQEEMITIGNLSLIKKMKNGMKSKEKYIIH